MFNSNVKPKSHGKVSLATPHFIQFLVAAMAVPQRRQTQVACQGSASTSSLQGQETPSTIETESNQQQPIDDASRSRPRSLLFSLSQKFGTTVRLQRQSRLLWHLPPEIRR